MGVTSPVRSRIIQSDGPHQYCKRLLDPGIGQRTGTFRGKRIMARLRRWMEPEPSVARWSVELRGRVATSDREQLGCA